LLEVPVAVAGGPIEKSISGRIAHDQVARADVARLSREAQQSVLTDGFASFDHLTIAAGEGPRDDRRGNGGSPDDEVGQGGGELVPIQNHNARSAAETVHGNVVSRAGCRGEDHSALAVGPT